MKEKQKNDDPVITNVTKFLNSKSADLMKCCYASIRGKDMYRHFEGAIVEDEIFDSLFPLVSNVILTANKIECDSLNYIVSKQENNCLKKRKHLLPIFDDFSLYAPEAYIFRIHSAYILHLNSCETGSNTPGGSADLVRFISKHQFLRPSTIVSFGICYGRDPSKQNFGDVIVPQKLYPWSIGQKINENSFSIKHDNFNLWLAEKFATSGIYSYLSNFCNGEDGTVLSDALVLGNANTTCEFHINISLGNMSTGEAVVSSADVKKMIREAARNEAEVGGEMEGYGIAKECIYYAHIPCFIIKAICDWGELKNIDEELDKRGIEYPANLKDQLQAYAAFCAGIALMRLFDQEKKELLSLELVKSMGKKKRGRVNKYNYAEKEAIVAYIAKYYNTSFEKAQEIFIQLLESHVICESVDKGLYNINLEI